MNTNIPAHYYPVEVGDWVVIRLIDEGYKVVGANGEYWGYNVTRPSFATQDEAIAHAKKFKQIVVSPTYGTKGVIEVM